MKNIQCKTIHNYHSIWTLFCLTLAPNNHTFMVKWVNRYMKSRKLYVLRVHLYGRQLFNFTDEIKVQTNLMNNSIWNGFELYYETKDEIHILKKTLLFLFTFFFHAAHTYARAWISLIWLQFSYTLLLCIGSWETFKFMCNQTSV